jgi:hypothetical protein
MNKCIFCLKTKYYEIKPGEKVCYFHLKLHRQSLNKITHLDLKSKEKNVFKIPWRNFYLFIITFETMEDVCEQS